MVAYLLGYLVSRAVISSRSDGCDRDCPVVAGMWYRWGNRYGKRGITGAMLAFLCCAGLVTGQNMTFDHLTIDQGLSNNTVYAIAEDLDGFLWFGTRDGLNRYDGYEFRIYKANSSDNHSLPGNNIQSLFLHPGGDLWIGLRTGGLCILDRETQQFRDNPFAGQVFANWATVSVQVFFLDSRGYIWMGTSSQGVVRIGPGLKQLDYFGIDAERRGRRMQSNACFSFVEDDRGRVWMGTSEGRVHYYDPQTDSVGVLEGDPEAGIDLYSYTKSLLIRNDVLWIGTEGNGLALYDLKNGRFLQNKLGKSLIRDIKQSGDMVLISTDGAGLWYTRDEGRTFHSVQFIPDLVNSLNTNALYDIFIDRSQNIWIGTFNGGVNVHKPRKTEFLTYKLAPNTVDAPGNQSVLVFHEDRDGYIWIGKDGGGLLRFNQGDQTYTTYRSDPTDPATLSSNVVTAIYEDSKRRLWIGTFAYGLNLFDRKRGVLRTFQYDADNPLSISNNNVWAITEDRAGNLWVGTLGGGLNRFNYREDRFERIQPDPVIPNRSGYLSDWNVRVLLVDSHDDLWIGTEFGGLNKRDHQTGKISTWRADTRDSSALQSSSILCLHQDRNGQLWIGTEGGGLHAMLADGRSFRHYTVDDGLPSNVINAIEEDPSGTFWISTNLGLASFQPQTGAITTYNNFDGLQSNQFNPDASLSSRSGAIYFGGINGVNVFRPEEVKANLNPPQVVFTDFKLFNKSVQAGVYKNRRLFSGPLNNQPVIRLEYSDNVFTIEFAALEFTNPAKNQYQYRLDGFEDKWNPVSAGQRRATYTNLDAGDYVFRVKASNNNGVWSGRPAELFILISPPFWETWWFRLLLALLIIGLIAMYIIYRDNKRREEHQKELLKAEQEILRLRNERLSEEVQQKNAQLAAALLQSAHKNTSLDGLKKQLTDISREAGADPDQKREIRQLVRRIDVELTSEDYWEQFQLNFDQVHQQFAKKLHLQHPQLSPNDIRLCCLIRINMTNKEIASIQNISLSAVEKSKYRLKKKLLLDKDADLNLYILDLD
ncbi:MAG: hypothetical protein EP344_04060 [Bacteroidetes bacterium]|nr:MAG: hypothetical protein EP344_04060 [Bacteroidota bacterium]